MNAFDIIKNYGSLKTIPIYELEKIYNSMQFTEAFFLPVQQEVAYRLVDGDREESKVFDREYLDRFCGPNHKDRGVQQ